MLKNYSHLELAQWIEHELTLYKFPNPKKLAQNFDMSERNARRYFEKIQNDLKFPIEYNKEEGGWYLLNKIKSVPGLWTSQ